MQLRTQIAAVAAAAALVGGAWLWWSAGQPAPTAGKAKTGAGGATRVLVEPVSRSPDKVTVRAIGTGEALKSAVLFPKIAGEVTEVLFRPQERVKQGQPLLRLDDSHQKIALRIAEVELAEANRQWNRVRKLAPSGAASQAQLDSTQTAVEAARLRVDQAKQALDDRTVYAPFDGIIGLTDIDPGDRVSTETQIAILDDRSEILVEFDLPEEYAGRVRLGDPINLRPWTMPDAVLSGTIAQSGSRIDAVSRTLRVKARIANTDDSIRPGTSFAVELDFTGKAYPAIREVAVLWSRDGAYLWRVAGEEGKAKAEKVFVTIVRRDRGRILVDGPLAENDVIVVEGVQGLRPGQRVTTAPYDADAANAAKPPAKKTPGAPTAPAKAAG